MGRYYERQQNDREMAITYYQEAIYESYEMEQSYATYYALGKLNDGTQAAANFFSKAKSLIPDSQLQTKVILEQKCSKNKSTTSNESTNTTGFKKRIPDLPNKENEADDHSQNESLTFEPSNGMFNIDFPKHQFLRVRKDLENVRFSESPSPRS